MRALNKALKILKSIPGLSVAATITFMPVTDVEEGPAMCIECGILIIKVLG
jgi:hypothetical protein